MYIHILIYVYVYMCVCTFVTSGLIKTLFVGFKYICRYNYIYIYIHKDPVLCISIYIHIHTSIFICICMRVYFITLQLYSIIISHDGAYAKRMAGVKGQNSSSASEYTPHQCLHKHTHTRTHARKTLVVYRLSILLYQSPNTRRLAVLDERESVLNSASYTISHAVTQ